MKMGTRMTQMLRNADSSHLREVEEDTGVACHFSTHGLVRQHRSARLHLSEVKRLFTEQRDVFGGEGFIALE